MKNTEKRMLKKYQFQCCFLSFFMVCYIMSKNVVCQKNNINNSARKAGKEEGKMKITVCIGSSCHIKGSRHVVERLQELVDENKLGEKVELAGTFCLGQCQLGVCVTVDEKFCSVTPETVDEFFENEVMAKV